MSKHVTAKVLRLIVSNHNHPNFNRLVQQKYLNHISYTNQRSYVDFNDIFSKLKDNLSKLQEITGNKLQQHKKQWEKTIHEKEKIFKETTTVPKETLSVQQKQEQDKVETSKNVCLKNIKTESTSNSTENSFKNTNDLLFDFYKNHPELTGISSKDIKQNYDVLLRFNISENTIRNNIQLLADNQLEEKLNLISEFGLSMNNGVLFAEMNLKDLSSFLQSCEKENIQPADKIKALCKLSKVNITKMCEYFIECRRLRSGSLSSLKEKIQFLLDEGLQMPDIIEKNYLLHYKLETIKNKLESSKKKSLNAPNIEAKTKKESEKNGKTETDSLINFMIEKMKCDKDAVMNIISKNPKLKNMKLENIEKVFNLFEEHNISLSYLIQFPHLFSRRIISMKSRLEKLEEVECDDLTKISYLIKETKTFEKLINKQAKRV